MIFNETEEFSTDGIIAETLEEPLQLVKLKKDRLSSVKPLSAKSRLESLYNIRLEKLTIGVNKNDPETSIS